MFLGGCDLIHNSQCTGTHRSVNNAPQYHTIIKVNSIFRVENQERPNHTGGLVSGIRQVHNGMICSTKQQ